MHSDLSYSRTFPTGTWWIVVLIVITLGSHSCKKKTGSEELGTGAPEKTSPQAEQSPPGQESPPPEVPKAEGAQEEAEAPLFFLDGSLPVDQACREWLEILIEEPARLPLDHDVIPQLLESKTGYPGFSIRDDARKMISEEDRSASQVFHHSLELEKSAVDGEAIRCRGTLAVSNTASVKLASTPRANKLKGDEWHSTYQFALTLAAHEGGRVASEASLINVSKAFIEEGTPWTLSLDFGESTAFSDLDGKGSDGAVYFAHSEWESISPLPEDLIAHNPGSKAGARYRETYSTESLVIISSGGRVLLWKDYTGDYDASHNDSDCEPPDLQEPSYGLVELGLRRLTLEYDEADGPVAETVRCWIGNEKSKGWVEVDPVYFVFDGKKLKSVFKWQDRFGEKPACDEIPSWGGWGEPVQVEQGAPWEIHVELEYDERPPRIEIWRFNGSKYEFAEMKDQKAD